MILAYTLGMNKLPYKVEIRLGQGAWRYGASYKTREKAEQVIAFWKGQKGAVNGEPFDARIKEGQ